MLFRSGRTIHSAHFTHEFKRSSTAPSFDASTLLSIDPEPFGIELTSERLCRRVDFAQDRELTERTVERPFDFTQGHERVEWQMMNDKQLYDLTNTASPNAVLDEVQIILGMISPHFDLAPVSQAFKTIVRLYEGKLPGFKACNTEYHDLRHTIETFLAMARLLHGAQLNGEGFAEPHVTLGLAAALFHDAGYIQEKHDMEGTGAKYTVHHEHRSAHLLERFGAEFGLSEEEIEMGRMMILGTDISIDLSTLTFPSDQAQLLCQMLTASDLMAQMADRSYLEKLLFLYHEFEEANVSGYESEVDLLKKTVLFYQFVEKRLETILHKANRFMTSHFVSRWNIHSNLYEEAMERQKNYLQQILKIPELDPREQLKRGGIVKKVREKYKKND